MTKSLLPLIGAIERVISVLYELKNWKALSLNFGAMKLMSHIFDSDRSLRILDIGCGAGFSALFSLNWAIQVHGYRYYT